jgi:hypothetical protein
MIDAIEKGVLPVLAFDRRPPLRLSIRAFGHRHHLVLQLPLDEIQ